MGQIVKMPGTGQGRTIYINKYINYINNNKNIYSSTLASTLRLWYECQLRLHEPYLKNQAARDAVKYFNELIQERELEEIHQAIKNYAEILHSPNCFYSHPFRFHIFLKYGYQDFVSGVFELEDFLRWGQKEKEVKYKEQQGHDKQLVSQALACFRNNPGCFSNSQKEVCVVCRKYR